MKTKKTKLIQEYMPEFDLIGIVCTCREYKLAWHLNNSLEILLAKNDDIKIEFSNTPSLLILNYRFENEFTKIELLQNKLLSKGPAKFLIPELKQFDFILKVHDTTGDFEIDEINSTLKEISVIEYCLKLKFDDLKSNENLLY